MTARTIYFAQWDNKDFAWGLSAESTRKTVEGSFRFGDPRIEELALGNSWAQAEGESGWRIVSREMIVSEVSADILGSLGLDRTHLSWQCPVCGMRWTEDLEAV